MKYEIKLKDLRFYAYHGVMEEEKRIGNEFRVSATVAIPCSSTIETDNISNTLSYVSLYEIINESMQESRNLLERVAYDIVNKIKERFKEVEGGKIEIEKVHPPIPGMLGSASVVLEF
ncbi:MAG: dihydroneopterin aldolase [Muribaculaceae bacterium]|nr:dihydroneopterin aldolase [Muribaculaceae bacterium]